MKSRYAVFGQDGMRLGYVDAVSYRGARTAASRQWCAWKWKWVNAVDTLARPDEGFFGRAIGAVS